MTAEYKQSVIRYFRKELTRHLAFRLLVDPCEINASLLEFFMDMEEEEFVCMLIQAFKNVEKRETGIEPVMEDR